MRSLFEIVDAGDAPGAFLGAAQRRQEHGSQDAEMAITTSSSMRVKAAAPAPGAAGLLSVARVWD